MRQINIAVREKDLSTLQRLAQEADAYDERWDNRAIIDKLQWAHREIARLDTVIQDQETELVTLRASTTAQLWSRHQAGEAIFESLERDLTAELKRTREHLDKLVSAYTDLVGERLA
jgi:hypothetical protein